MAALQSPRTRSEQAPEELVEAALSLFSYTVADLDPRLPPAIADAGARHLVLALTNRQNLAAMHYDLEQGRQFMTANGIVTVSLVHAETNTLFHARNPFAAGGVYEDPATGAAAAAFAGYLRDLGWPHGGAIEILQGEDMGVPSRLRAEITSEPGCEHPGIGRSSADVVATEGTQDMRDQRLGDTRALQRCGSPVPSRQDDPHSEVVTAREGFSCVATLSPRSCFCCGERG